MGDALGAWIRGVRTGQGISQRALADRAGVSRSYLCDIERGRGARPSVAILARLAGALGASRLDLLRAAGAIEPGAAESGDRGVERRLLALFRALSDDGRAAVERFARFTHDEEHRWVQPGLPDGDDAAPVPAHQAGPTLFDALDGS